MWPVTINILNGYFFFQVDMKALPYMNEEDMKSSGIPIVLHNLWYIQLVIQLAPHAYIEPLLYDGVSIHLFAVYLSFLLIFIH